SIVLLCIALAAPSLATNPPCPVACPYSLFNNAPVAFDCNGNFAIASCPTGKSVNCTSDENLPISFEKATCMGGKWYGTTCSGFVFLPGANPVFGCTEVEVPATTVKPTTGPTTTAPTVTGPTTTAVKPTTGPTTTGPTVTTTASPTLPPCSGLYTDAGALQNMPPPRSSCTNGENRVLECDDDQIFVKTASGLIAYDKITFANGVWFGSNCDGTLIAIEDTTVIVQCGAEAEPPLCSVLPARGGLKFLGMFKGLQRYGCSDERMIQLTANVSLELTTTTHGLYFDCNNTYSHVGSAIANQFLKIDLAILSVSCRSPGQFEQACSVPLVSNAIRKDGKLKCEKGYFVDKITYLDATNNLVTLTKSQASITGAKCEVDGWKIEGSSSVSGVQIVSFSCGECSPTSVEGTCPAIIFSKRNIELDYSLSTFQCGYMEELTITDSAGVKIQGSKLKCVSGVWQLTGSSGVKTVTAGSKVSCLPKNSPMLPIDTFSLIFAGISTDGYMRWTCSAEQSLVLTVASE
ncbi:hypothetical protein PFISCL1PPCAC_4882, partial [Pristionchus fissidentatus]